MSQADWIEEEPTHPPIPPNCQFFGIHEGECYFEAFSMTQTIRRWLSFDIDNLEKKIIAAVARCAWRDERDKYNAYADAGDKRGEQYKKWKECFDNEQAWRIWGEQK